MTKIKKTRAIRLCALDEIPGDQSRGFMIDYKDFPLSLFMIRKNGHIYAYHNRCPHMGTSLDWQPDQFLDASGDFIQCSTHGALFRIQDGLCLYGPCARQSLTNIPTEIRDNDVYIHI